MGYHLAGFQVIGVDHEPQPNYPFQFIQGDAIRYLQYHSQGYEAIHASPPCQASCALIKGTNREARAHHHTNLIPAVRNLLSTTKVPWVIENVQGAQVRRDLTLCGEMFGLGVLRHRYFEFGNVALPQPAVHKPHRGRVAGWRHGVYYDGPYFAVYGDGGGKGSLAQWRTAMGISWMETRHELAESIPPKYTELVGRHLQTQMSNTTSAS